MFDLKCQPKHNVVGFMNEDCPEAAGYEVMIRYLLRTEYVYAICVKPIIYDCLIKRFWDTALTAINVNGQKVVREFVTQFRMIEVSEQSIIEALTHGDNASDDVSELTLDECIDIFIIMAHFNNFPKQQFREPEWLRIGSCYDMLFSTSC